MFIGNSPPQMTENRRQNELQAKAQASKRLYSGSFRIHEWGCDTNHLGAGERGRFCWLGLRLNFYSSFHFQVLLRLGFHGGEDGAHLLELGVAVEGYEARISQHLKEPWAAGLV